MLGLTAAMLTGCVGPLVAIDDPLTAKPKVTEIELVEGPIKGAVVVGGVEGYSCKNKIWDPAPTNAFAGKQLQMQAEKLGANAVSDVKYYKSGTTFQPNCWSSIRATGVAVRR